ncbi:MAG TPA: putative toxin-antitoxin system toxin component, PIN family [Thermoanaerobaculia bacterium]|nr:putative toxin-antitoxin system toxin component, PIN family [Thermoanaerobaculia bacterium]
MLLRVCLDTNVLVAAFATRGLCTDVLRTVLSEHELIIGEVILDELRRVLSRKLRLPADRILAAELVFEGIQVIPKPDSPSPIRIRDRADRWVLATALAGEADVLVTGDEDLLVVAADAPLKILSPRAFWELLRGGVAR